MLLVLELIVYLCFIMIMMFNTWLWAEKIINTVHNSCVILQILQSYYSPRNAVGKPIPMLARFGGYPYHPKNEQNLKTSEQSAHQSCLQIALVWEKRPSSYISCHYGIYPVTLFIRSVNDFFFIDSFPSVGPTIILNWPTN